MIKINNFYIYPVLNNIVKKDLINLVLILKHEKIHAKIFKLFKVKRTKIYVIYGDIDEKYCYLQGWCKPLETPHITLTLFMHFFHFVYDVMCDIINLNIKKLKIDIKDFLKLIK